MFVLLLTCHVVNVERRHELHVHAQTNPPVPLKDVVDSRLYQKVDVKNMAKKRRAKKGLFFRVMLRKMEDDRRERVVLNKRG